MTLHLTCIFFNSSFENLFSFCNKSSSSDDVEESLFFNCCIVASEIIVLSVSHFSFISINFGSSIFLADFDLEFLVFGTADSVALWITFIDSKSSALFSDLGFLLLGFVDSSVF